MFCLPPAAAAAHTVRAREPIFHLLIEPVHRTGSHFHTHMHIHRHKRSLAAPTFRFQSLAPSAFPLPARSHFWLLYQKPRANFFKRISPVVPLDATKVNPTDPPNFRRRLEKAVPSFIYIFFSLSFLFGPVRVFSLSPRAGASSDC